ncbi:MAG: hypothetical protein CVU54_17350 [Deltaproteobacteria bacterium HGW-Deltaproteobacteria-12]|jgi:hypothetical protein|nr:MAG: hypothetical protein CVU54_17350 [Deltaproteobacteria bacterium HGW-Deltaproteobacteria-12]
MKRFWLVLLSLGLIMAFSTSAFAVDVKFSGSYYAAGMYLNKTSLQDVAGMNSLSTAMYFQRLRLRTEFVVAPGVSLITRMDMMERAWGAARTAPGVAAGNQSSATVAENENIAVDQVYVSAVTPIGMINAGYMPDGMYGTMFMNSDSQAAKISYILPIGKLMLAAQVAKASEASAPYSNALAGVNMAASDNDYDLYYLMGIYRDKGIEAGMLYMYIRNALPRPVANFKAYYHLFSPYVKATLGPVYVEAEVRYNTGMARKMDSGAGDISYEALAAYLSATATFGPAYVGGTFAYLRGDDPATLDKVEGDLTGGQDWNPCLILFNYDRTTWAGAMPGYNGAGAQNQMANAWFYQVKGGVKPTDKLDIGLSVSMATADKVAAGWVSKDYGYEVDVTGTYKITNNLSYMLGFGYLISGDYFKGLSSANAVANNYLVINKLTLTF